MTPSDPAATPPRRRSRRTWRIKFAALMRWLHIYSSMFGLAVTLFFGLTGLTLNHPTWFAESVARTEEAEGRIDPKWLGAPDDETRPVDKLAVVEHLRRAHGVSGSVAEFRADETECLVTFKGPGYGADAVIDRGTGHYTLSQVRHGFVAILNDLHKGRDTGPAWSLLIDVSAVLLALISLTGLVLLFYLKLRRKPGVVVALVGAVVTALVVYLSVP